MIAFRLKTGLMAAGCVLALSAAGCREEDAGQRIAVPDPTPAALVADPMALPFAEAAPVQWTGADAGYQWAERAYGLEQAVYGAPPDYAFDYGGVDPWVWETADDWAMYAEPWDEGYRYYYYEPGAAYPYFVRDGQYGYGFDPAGALVALFDADGDYLPADRFYEAAPLAGRYYLHGRDLRNAAVQARRAPVSPDRWTQRAPQIQRTSEPWLQAARSDERWRGWRDRQGDRELARFAQEERRRARQAQNVRQMAEVQPQRAPQERRWDEPRRIEARRDLAKAQREELRAQREQARTEQRRGERELAQRARSEQRQQQAQARAAEAHARQAAAQARAAQDRGPRAERRPERQGRGPERQARPERQEHGGGGGKPDRGGGNGNGNGKGGGKKD